MNPTGADTLERTEQKVREPQKTGAESPFLNALVARLVFDAKNQVLEIENRQLLAENKELTEKVELRKKQNREAEARYRNKDPEAYRAKKAEEMRQRYWAKKKQDSESQT